MSGLLLDADGTAAAPTNGSFCGSVADCANAMASQSKFSLLLLDDCCCSLLLLLAVVNNCAACCCSAFCVSQSTTIGAVGGAHMATFSMSTTAGTVVSP